MNTCNQSPEIAVVMGVYNIVALAGFEEAVESVLDQSYSNLEFIICDDGSVDGTWELLQHLAAEDDRIVLLRHTTNMGLASALNTCIKEARGAFIARQDADDQSEICRFEKQLAFLQHHPEIGFCGSNVSLFDENGIWGERKFPAYPQAEDFLFTMPFVHGALMFRKEALERVNGYRVAKETRRAEDYDMLMRMYANGTKGANLREKLYHFREDIAAQKRRKYKYRIDDVKVRYLGFKALGYMPKAWPYVLKPLIVGLIPNTILLKLKKHRKY